MAKKINFWEKKNLQELNKHEWESLCDRCGKCCLIKLEDIDTGEIELTNISCKLLCTKTCKCLKYKSRKKVVEDCIKLTYHNLIDLKWMPKTCSYVLISQGKKLPSWHHLISGDYNSVHTSGNSVLGKTVKENKNLNLEDHIVDKFND